MSFIECHWACMKCKKTGCVYPWGYDGETPLQTSRRHAASTRANCVAGCIYAALPTSELPQSDDAVVRTATNQHDTATREEDL